VRYWIGLGSNLGDRLDNLRRAVERLSACGAIVARSRVFAASAVGGPPQPSFLNGVLVLDSALDPEGFFRTCRTVEDAGGRDRSSAVRWGPRTIDVDLLLAGARGEVVLEVADLVIPHPRLHERGFVLQPLVELDPLLVHPTLRRPLSALLAASAHLGHAVAPTGETL
jgi:2-amino-4-hydroxy-6-hydroxymethyldihydropteridine diphosphokinase